MSILEILIVFPLIIGSGVAVGLSTFHELGVVKDNSVAYGVITSLVLLVTYLVVRSILVRRGISHPIGTMEDAKNHKCCPRRR